MTGSWTPIGIDVGSRRVKAVQLSRAGGRWRLTSAVNIPRLEPGAEVTAAECDRLAGVLHRHGFVGDEAVLACPGWLLSSTVVELPPRSSGAPVEQIARVEVARSLRREVGSFELAAWELPAGGRVSEVPSSLAVALAHDAADAILDRFEAAGLEVVGIDVPGPALVSACVELLSSGDVKRVDAVIDLSWSAATIGLVAGGVLTYERRIEEAGLAPSHVAAAKALGVTIDQAESFVRRVCEPGAERRGVAASVARDLSKAASVLAGEVTASMDYATHRWPEYEPGAVVLCGGGADLPWLVELIRSASSGATRASVSATGCGEGARAESAAFGLAIGASLRAVHAIPMRKGAAA